jgi:hypothetical protein
MFRFIHFLPSWAVFVSLAVLPTRAQDFAPLDSTHTWVYQGEFSGILVLPSEGYITRSWRGPYREKLTLRVGSSRSHLDTVFTEVYLRDSIYERGSTTGAPNLPDTVLNQGFTVAWKQSQDSLFITRYTGDALPVESPAFFLTHFRRFLETRGRRILPSLPPFNTGHYEYKSPTSFPHNKRSYSWYFGDIGLSWNYSVHINDGMCARSYRELSLVSMNGKAFEVSDSMPDSLKNGKPFMAKQAARQCADIQPAQTIRYGSRRAIPKFHFDFLGRTFTPSTSIHHPGRTARRPHHYIPLNPANAW